MARSLHYAQADPEAMAVAALGLLGPGRHCLSVRPWDNWGQSVAAEIHKRCPDATFILSDAQASGCSDLARAMPGERAELDMLACQDPEILSDLLMEHLNSRDVRVLAPITSRYFRNQPLFLISIPKAGTHLLFELVKNLGYTSGISFSDVLRSGHWYGLDPQDTHTEAKHFFIENVRRSHFGHRYHPFPQIPGLFIYRNPLDILLSEAHYYHHPGNAAYSGLLESLTLEQRLLRFLDDPYLLGSLRDRICGFTAWLDAKNIIPVSFEELIGGKGGGDDQVQEMLIWSIMLKLQIPGDPVALGKALYNPKAITFNKGKIGRYLEELPVEVLRRLERMPQDFLKIFGYEGAVQGRKIFPPDRSEEFRCRPLKLAAPVTVGGPITVRTDYLGYNIIYYKNMFYALPESLDGDHVQELPQALLSTLPKADRLEVLKMILVLDQDQVVRARHRAGQEWTAVAERAGGPDAPPPFADQGSPTHLEDRSGFSIIRQQGYYFVLRHALGPVDMSLPFETLRTLHGEQDLLRLTNFEQARMAVDLILAREATDSLRQEAERMKQEAASQRQEMASQRQEIDSQRQEIDSQRQEIDSQRQEIDSQRQEMDNLRRGFSWVVTELWEAGEQGEEHLREARDLREWRLFLETLLGAEFPAVLEGLKDVSYSRIFQSLRMLGGLRRKRHVSLPPDRTDAGS